MRRPQLLTAEFFPALAQQTFQRLHRGADAERYRLRRRPVALFALRLKNVGEFVVVRCNAFSGIADQRLGRVDIAAKCVIELRIDRGWTLGGVAALRTFLEFLRFAIR